MNSETSHPWRQVPVEVLVLLVLYAALLICTASAWTTAGLNPPSLWADDLWVSALVKLSTLRQILTIQTSAPAGFLLLLRFVSRIVTDPEIGMQILPLGVGLLCIPVFGLLAGHLTGDRWLGLAGASLVASINSLANYSLRVKMYSFDFLTGAILILVALRCLDKPSSRCLLRLALLSLFCLLFSFSSLLVAVSLFVACLLCAFVRRRDLEPGEGNRLLLVAVFYGLALIWWYVFEVLPRASEEIVRYWHAHFAPMSSWRDYGDFLLLRGGNTIRGAFPERAPWLMWLTPAGLVFVLTQRKVRFYGVAALLFLCGLLIANALRIYPLGKPRLDIFTYPVTLSLVCVGVHGLTHRLPRRRIVNAAIGILLFTAAVIHPGRSGYIRRGHAQMVALLQETAQPEDAVILHPLSSFAAAFYGDWADGTIQTTHVLARFAPRFRRARLLSLADKDAEVHLHIAAFLSDTRPGRVLYYGESFGNPDSFGDRADAAVREALAAAGYECTTIAESSGCFVVLLQQLP